jgi:hypothetical protein
MIDEISESTENQLIQEEYKIWKKNTPFLYDAVLTSNLDWPSLTVQWLPDYRPAVNHTECSTHKVLLGTEGDGTDLNYLMIAEVIVVSFVSVGWFANIYMIKSIITYCVGNVFRFYYQILTSPLMQNYSMKKREKS